MTDPKTLVARLRAENAMAGLYGPPALQVEAADRIEALEAALREAKGHLAHARGWHVSHAKVAINRIFLPPGDGA